MTTEVNNNRETKGLNNNIRVSTPTRELLNLIWESSNKTFEGKNKVKLDSIIMLGLSQLVDKKDETVKENFLTTLRKESLTVDDQFDIWKEVYAEISGDKTSKGFKLLVMSDKWSNFRKENKAVFEQKVA